MNPPPTTNPPQYDIKKSVVKFSLTNLGPKQKQYLNEEIKTLFMKNETLHFHIKEFPTFMKIHARTKDTEVPFDKQFILELAKTFNAYKLPPKITLTISENWIYFHTDLSENIRNLIDQELSYYVLGSEFSPAVEKGEWDGVKHLLQRIRKDNQMVYRCQAGFLERLKLFLKSRDIGYSIIETTLSIPKPIQIPSKCQPFIDAWQGYNLWPHQQDAFERLQMFPRGIISIATGGGKSLLMAYLIQQRKVPTNVFINSIDVGRQLQEVFQMNLGIASVGFVGDSECEIVPGGVNVILLPTAYLSLLAEKRIKKWEVIQTKDGKKEYKLVQIANKLDAEKYPEIVACIENAEMSLYDECDMLGAETYAAVSKNTHSRFNYGFSATPYRNDAKDLEIEGGCGKIVFRLSASDLIEREVLVPLEVWMFTIPDEIGISRANRYASIHKQCIQENFIRNDLIVRLVRYFTDHKQIGIVTVNRLKHGKLLTGLMRKQGVRAEFVSGKDSAIKRKDIIDLLRDKSIDVIVTTLFKRGTDIRELNYGIRAEGEGNSKIDLPNSGVIQACGRVIRAFPTKTKAIWCDFFDPYKYLRDHSQARIEAYESERNFKLRFMNIAELPETP